MNTEGQFKGTRCSISIFACLNSKKGNLSLKVSSSMQSIKEIMTFLHHMLGMSIPDLRNSKCDFLKWQEGMFRNLPHACLSGCGTQYQRLVGATTIQSRAWVMQQQIAQMLGVEGKTGTNIAWNYCMHRGFHHQVCNCFFVCQYEIRLCCPEEKIHFHPCIYVPKAALLIIFEKFSTSPTLPKLFDLSTAHFTDTKFQHPPLLQRLGKA